MQQIKYRKKKQQNKQLLFLFHKLLELQESYWSQIFRFQKSEVFEAFQKRFSVQNVIRIRLDDIIYLFLLAALSLTFGFLPLSSSNSLANSYHQSLILFYITTIIQLISPHSFRWIVLFIFCIIFPGLLFITFQGYISLAPFDTSQSIYNYIGYLTLVLIFILHILVYPLKEYMRKNIGALYSYIYALSISLILFMWPLYSFILEIANSGGSLTVNFITQNEPLLLTFITIIVTGFYFFTHNSIFEVKKEKIEQLLIQQFTQGELTRTVEENELQNAEEQSCIYSHYNIFVRCMSFLIYSTTLSAEILLFQTLLSNISQILTIVSIMGYLIVFLLLGSVINILSVTKEVIIPIISILSLASIAVSLTYYNSSTNWYNYVFLSISCPAWALFWSLIKSISIKRPIFKINALVTLYIFIYLPVIAFAMNSYGYFTSNSNTTSIITYLLYGIIGVSLLVCLIMFVMWQVVKCQREGEEDKKEIVHVDYHYFEQGDPPYQYYQVNSKFSMGYLIGIDLREIGFLFNVLFLITSCLVSIHAINQLKTTYANTTFYSSSINQIIYSQLPISLIFYLYAHIYIASSIQSYHKYLFMIIFQLLGIFCIAYSYFVSTLSTSLKLFGFFCVAMGFIALSFENIKANSIKIYNFISSIMIIALWVFIVLPFVIFIPFFSIFANQATIGNYIYGCILGSIVLLVFLVGLLTLIFNLLIDKYQEQKKFKFVMEDVKTLLDQQGVETRDEQLHILYESFLFRDKRYVFFLKRGFPVNLLKDPEDNITKLVTAADYSLQRIPTNKILKQQEEKQKSCLWRCLTFCCGEDEEQINRKIKKAKKIMNQQQLQQLIPKNLIFGLLKSTQQNKVLKKKEKKYSDANKIFSSTSLILKDLHMGPRYLGDQYILLKTNKNVNLAIQIWHNIYEFISNRDQGQPLVILNDFRLFMNASQINIQEKQIDHIFYDFSQMKWKDITAMNLTNFSVAIQKIAVELYPDENLDAQQRKFYLLINKVYYNLSLYEEFTNFLSERRAKNRVTKLEIAKSPFKTSLSRLKDHIQHNQEQQMRLIQKTKQHNENKFQEPKEETKFAIEKEEVEAQLVKQSTNCKRLIYQKVRQCQAYCKKEESIDQFQKKLFVRSWKMISVDAVRIIERKQIEWGTSSELTEHNFRLLSNNLLIAAVKFLDLYSYVNVSISNSQIGWISGTISSNLYFSYTIQIWCAYGIVAICVPLGIRGIMLIFQDRLGLTQNRLPAVFPHPMFFFTFIYKLLILTLFGIVSQTFLVSFNCNWTVGSPPYTLYDDTSIQCFSDSHTRFVIGSLIALIAYYPLSSYAMPNFQFAEKSLDVKFRPSYLILYFQVNFILLAGKVMLSKVVNSFTIQVFLNSLNISVLVFLCLCVLWTKPCLIEWFNYIQLLVIWIGVVVNAVGLALYLTRQWIICVITAGSLSFISIIITIIFINRKYFNKKIYDSKEEDKDNVKELENMWAYKQKKEKTIVQFQDRRGRKQIKDQQIVQVIDLEKGSDQLTNN